MVLSTRFKLDVCCNYILKARTSECVRKFLSKVIVDFNIYTGHVLSACRPKIVMIDKHNNTLKIIDISVPADSNVSSKETEKIDKYRDLVIELTSL